MDLEKRTITIKRAFSRNVLREVTKTRHVSVLPLYPWIEKMLRKMPRRSPAFVFVHPGTGRPYSSYQTTNIWNRAATRAGVRISLYEGTRHSAVTQMINAGDDLVLVGEMVGHQTGTTTKRYLQQDHARLVGLHRGEVVSPDFPLVSPPPQSNKD